jgi:SNF2 family DNA or RNA helicase
MRLTIEELKNINTTMLGLGAPVVLDGAGYSKIHYPMMLELHNASKLTNKQVAAMIRTMLVYSNTQLANYADALKETLAEVEKDIKTAEDAAMAVKVESFDTDSVSISWKFNRNVSEFIKASDRRNFKWSKTPEGKWILKLYWESVDDYMKVFKENGFNTTAVTEAHKKAADITTNSLKDEDGNQLDVVYELEVSRPANTIDTLVVKVNYHPAIAEAFDRVPFTYFNKTKGQYEVRIDEAAYLYERLSKCGKNIDMTQLEFWKNLVESWSQSYEMIDVSTTDIPFTPYDFQLVDIKEMLSKRVVLNANDMGCGKTMESVLTGESMPMKKLVICPATLRLNWAREMHMINNNADISVIYNGSEFKAGKDWTIIGYPSLQNFQKELEAEMFQCIFIDEAHYCQAINNSGNPDSIRAKAVLRLTATAGWVYPLTGTPKTNRNKNVFNILRMIRHDLAKGNWAFLNYGKTYCDGYKGSWGWDFEGNTNDADLNEKLRPRMIRHLKKEVLPNLKKQRIIIPVKVDLTEYNLTIAEYLKNRQSKEAEQLARLMRAKQILATQKVGETIDFVKDIVADGEKVIVVTCFTEVVKVIEKAFSGNVVKIVGGMSDAQKDAAKEEFQTGKTQVMVMNIVAGGVGLTLTASHKMVFNDFDFVPGNVTQAEDRICRSGQTECCMIYYMTAQGADIEEDFVDMLTYKTETINNAIDGGNGETIDFRSLVEKSAGITRENKTRRILQSGDVKQQESKNKTAEKAKKASKSVEKKASADYSKMTLEEIKNRIEELGGTFKQYDNEGITRMRAVMTLKKLVG